MGSHFIHYLLANFSDLKVINLDALTYAGRRQNNADLKNHPNFRFIKGDIRDFPLLQKIMCQNRINGVVNFAAHSHVDRSIIDPQEFISTNVGGATSLFWASLKQGVKKFLQVSTDEVYGPTLNTSFKEADKLSPTSPYAASKAAADLVGRSFFKTYGLPLIVVRSANNFGPRQFPEKLIPRLTVRALRHKKLPVYGQGKNLRDWIYVKDFCVACGLAFFSGTPGEIYNISAQQKHSNLNVAKAILADLNLPLSAISYIKDRPANDSGYGMDSQKMTRLGFCPQFNFFYALKATVFWYQKHPEFWQPLVN